LTSINSSLQPGFIIKSLREMIEACWFSLRIFIMIKSILKNKLHISTSVLTVGITIWASLGLQGCNGGDGFFENLTLCGVDQEAFLNSQSRIGGSSTVVRLLDPNDDWTIYNVANDLRATRVGITESAHYSLSVEGFIQDVDIVEYPANSGVRYALLSMGDKGIAVVDISDPGNMLFRHQVHVNYEQTGIPWTDGGGNVSEGNTISGIHAPISSLEIYTDGSDTKHLLIANQSYGLHKTLLSNLFDTAAGREADGTLKIDSETYTLQYAGENPWGGPESMKLYIDGADQGKLFVAMGYLGMGIFDPETIGTAGTAAGDQIGGYNLYLASDSKEDWFVNADGSNLDPATQVQYNTPVYGGGEGATWSCDAAGCLDPFTGMPDYRQAAYEIAIVWHDNNPDQQPAPWAAFDRYGKFYYKARKVDIATFNSGDPSEKTIAYIAYALGGLQAVDVTGYKTASSASYLDLDGKRLGHAPAVPANGPDSPTGAQSKSLFPYFGAGMLKESGVVDVKVDVAGNRIFFSDHFAGLVAMSNADNPAMWHGPNGPETYDNDTLPGPGAGPGGESLLGDHWPDYEFINSYNMTPYDPNDNESLPTWLYQSPTLLLSGEVSGHGNSFLLMPSTASGSFATAGEVDIVMSSGGGGISFIDVTDLTGNLPEKDGLDILVHISTTDERFREYDGSLSLDGLSVGHSAGVTVYRDKLFLADGPHGMTVWQFADAEKCLPLDEMRLLANTLQDEYPIGDINPTPHAYDVVLDASKRQAYVLSQSRGLRRVDTAAISSGEIPVLLQTKLSDIYEHNTDDGDSVARLRMQDHAYDVALDGNLAFVADGSNGLTVYDIGQPPTTVVDNIGGETRAKPALGHATAVKLWRGGAKNRKYAFVASGHAGIGVVDVTDATNMVLVKVFEPVKTETHEEDGVVTAQYNKADGKSVDVLIVGEHAYFTYDSFGVLAYRIADLIKPLPAGMDPTDIWERGEIGERPIAVARFKLQDPELFGSAELTDLNGGAQGMFTMNTGDKQLFYVAYDSAGVAKIDWTDVASPVLVQHIDTAGNASDVAVASTHVFVADGGGGLVIIK
jgi:hypothetical protein